METITQPSSSWRTWKKNFGAIPAVFKIRKFVKFISPRIELFNIINKVYVVLLLKKTQFYQPLYNLSVIKKKSAERICIDRADAIYQQMSSWGKGGSILDIGCNMGFFSHFFADRGFQVSGIDMNPNNITLCNLLQKVNQPRIHFSVDVFSDTFIEKLPNNQYETAFLFSVIHHVIYAKGLDYAQKLLASLLDKIPVLFIELALKSEASKSPWRQVAPENELDVFAQCKDITIRKLGYYETPRGIVRRPLYMVTKNRMNLCGEMRSVLSRSYSTYQNTHTHAYDCGDVYVEKHLLNNNKQTALSSEINHFKKLPKNDFLPTLLSETTFDNRIEVAYTKLPGKNLHECLVAGESLPTVAIVKDIIQGLTFLFEQGIYHNAVRLQNFIFDGTKTKILNLVEADSSEKESTNIALLWLISQLVHFQDYVLAAPLQKAPELKLEALPEELRDIVKNLQATQSFSVFLQTNRAC